MRMAAQRPRISVPPNVLLRLRFLCCPASYKFGSQEPTPRVRVTLRESGGQRVLDLAVVVGSGECPITPAPSAASRS
jgi:hypothetical protein